MAKVKVENSLTGLAGTCKLTISRMDKQLILFLKARMRIKASRNQPKDWRV
jgi:hypothetical protein